MWAMWEDDDVDVFDDEWLEPVDVYMRRVIRECDGDYGREERWGDDSADAM